MEKYVKVRIWKNTLKNLEIKKGNIERELKERGIIRKIPMTRLMHAMSRAPFYPDEAGITNIKQLAYRRYKI